MCCHAAARTDFGGDGQTTKVTWLVFSGVQPRSPLETLKLSQPLWVQRPQTRGTPCCQLPGPAFLDLPDFYLGPWYSRDFNLSAVHTTPMWGIRDARAYFFKILFIYDHVRSSLLDCVQIRRCSIVFHCPSNVPLFVDPSYSTGFREHLVNVESSSLQHLAFLI